MGVKTALSLEEANALFEGYRFESIHPTRNGIMDTTYIVHDNEGSYILKKYEVASQKAIEEEQRLLEKLQQQRLNTPSRLASNGEWHLYTLLKGEVVGSVRTEHLQQLARTLARMHHATLKMPSSQSVLHRSRTIKMLQRLKRRHFAHYKRLSPLHSAELQSDGVIHGDLFLDNVLFDEGRIGVIDFIDAGRGSFAFDLGVVALVWGVRGSCVGSLQLLLKSYNRHAPKRISREELCKSMRLAAQFYTLSRLDRKGGDFSHRTQLMQRLKLLGRSGLC